MLCGGENGASAQQRVPRIWDIPLGIAVGDLPAAEFVDPACGTNGGPAGLPIGNFDQFRKCPAEAGGLREIWFIYDDTLEYVGLARREPLVPKATAVLDQPVVLSVLLDGDGRVRGFRIFTDSRAEPGLRLAAHEVSFAYKARYGLDEGCADLPAANGETPIDGRYIKELCHKESGGRSVTVETHYYYRPGHQVVDPLVARPTVNEFESWVRLEVLQIGPRPAVEVGHGAAAPDPGARGLPVSERSEAFLSGQTVVCPGCDLAGADLRRRDLTGADLSGANLEGALFHRAILRGANLAGANLADANLNRANLSFANLQNATLINAMLFHADAGRASFSGADLAGAMMGKAQLILADFGRANLDFADLGEAQLNDASLVNATLNDAYLPLAAMFRADLRGAVAERAMLAQVSLRGANLGGAVFRGANLYGADLAGADMNDADFSGARLVSANLTDALQSGTIFAGAQMPDNSVHR